MNKLFSYRDGYRSFSFAVAVYFVSQLLAGLCLLGAETGSVLYWIVLAVSNILLGASALAYSRIAKVSLGGFKLNKKPKALHVLWACVAIVGLIHCMTSLTNWIGILFEKVGLNRPSVDLPMQMVPLIIVAGIVPAFSEELLFRGAIGNGLSREGMWKGSLICGALFSLFHMNPAQTLHQFVLGTFLCVLVYRSDSLWTAIIAHLFNNVLVVILTFFVEPTGFYENNDVVLFFAGLALFALSAVGYMYTTKNHGKLNGEPTAEEGERGKLDSTALVLFVVAAAACFVVWVAALFS